MRSLHGLLGVSRLRMIHQVPVSPMSFSRCWVLAFVSERHICDTGLSRRTQMSHTFSVRESLKPSS